jgi:hypothetical protein
MPTRTSQAGSELFIVDNSDEDWKVRRYLHDWCQISSRFDIATGYFEIGSLLSLDGEWQKLDKLRILMGNEVSMRTRAAFEAGLARITDRLDASLESEKTKNDFLRGVPAIAEATCGAVKSSMAVSPSSSQKRGTRRLPLIRSAKPTAVFSTWSNVRLRRTNRSSLSPSTIRWPTARWSRARKRPSKLTVKNNWSA